MIFFSIVTKWTSRFKFGRESLNDNLHNGRSKRATTPEFITKGHKMVMEDCQLKVREIAEAIGVSFEWVYQILIEELGMKKLSARYHIFEMGSRHWNVAGPNALVHRETMMKNKNSPTEVRHFFPVHSEAFSNNSHKTS